MNHQFSLDFPDRLFRIFRASKSVGRQALWSSGTSFDGFWDCRIVKGLVGYCLRLISPRISRILPILPLVKVTSSFLLLLPFFFVHAVPDQSWNWDQVTWREQEIERRPFPWPNILLSKPIHRWILPRSETSNEESWGSKTVKCSAGFFPHHIGCMLNDEGRQDYSSTSSNMDRYTTDLK